MNDSRKFTRGEIYYIKKFPSIGHEQRSGRPAIIVSNNENNTYSDVMEICYLTLKEKPNLPTHVRIDCGPCKDSTILCEQVTSVSVEKIGDYVGRLPSHLVEQVNHALSISIGLCPVKELPSTPIFIREKAAELEALKDENGRMAKALMENKKVIEELHQYKDKANMYEKMYNDIVNRLVRIAHEKNIKH